MFRRLGTIAHSFAELSVTSHPCVCPAGIETRPGRGRYGDTHIITVSPRFQVDNRSSHRLLLSQLHFAESFVSRDRRRPDREGGGVGGDWWVVGGRVVM